MKTILVWDWPIRVCHWSMVLLFTGLIVTGRYQRDFFEYHFYFGYALSAVIIFRVIYGFYGSRYAKFSQFLKGPKAIYCYAISILKRRPKISFGHNPVGACMVIGLLLALTFQWVSGLFTSDDVFWFGPLTDYVSYDWLDRMSFIHHTLPNILLALVGVHIVAVLYHEFCLKERLIKAMLNGKKTTKAVSNQTVKSPRWGVIFALFIGLSWLVWLWSLPV